MSGLAPQPALAVAISTYKRNRGLEALLDGLERQCLGDLADGAVTIVVADNSPAGEAAPIIAARRLVSRFAFHHVHEPRKGLCFARNATLEAALRRGATHIAFVDDDEIPDPAWLAALYDRLRESGATAAIGPVTPIFEAIPPAWAVQGGYFAKRLPEQDGVVQDGYTSSALVDLAPVRRLGLRFDPAFNETGGEDTFFFRALREAGETLVWANRAIVHEQIPASRTSRIWLCRRWYRTGGTEALLSRLPARSARGRLYNLGRGMLRVAAGACRLLAALPLSGRHPQRLTDAAYTISRGAGLIAFAFGRTYAEYAASSYR